MTPRQRLAAALRGERVDRIPWALWRHFPGDDQDAAALAARTLEFQRKFEFDFVKITPAAGYLPEAWGVKLSYRENDEGVRSYDTVVIENPEDWGRLPKLDVRAGVLGRELKAVELIRTGVDASVPVLETVFSPVSVAAKLAGPNFAAHLRAHPHKVRTGLETIARTLIEFCHAAFDAGADGVFFSTQAAGSAQRSTALEWDKPFSRMVLEAIRPRAEVIVLHLHGQPILFDEYLDLPVDVVNWPDRRTAPTLREAAQRTTLALCGGLQEWTTLLSTPEAVRAQVHDAVRQTEGRRFVLGAGCVLPLSTPEATLHAARQALLGA